MKNKIYSLLLIILCVVILTPTQGMAKGKKRGRKDATEEKAPAKAETAYDKLFKNKKVVTAQGVMKVHLVDGNKVLVEIPSDIMNRDFMFVSDVDYTSNSNEGVVGARAAQSLSFNFVKVDSTIYMQPLKTIPRSSDDNISQAIADANMPSSLFKYDIKAYTPDSTAYVIDVTNLFADDLRYNKPFPRGAASTFGFVDSSMAYSKEKSSLLGIDGGEGYLTVRCELAYELTKKFFGIVELGKEPFLMGVSRHIMLLPEKVMPSRPADPRLNLTQMSVGGEYESNSFMKTNYRAVRWNITPSDSAAYARGELVEPLKPILFYVDSLMPRVWKNAVIEGFHEWNKAFEAIGFKNVVRIVPVPADSSVNLSDPNVSWIGYTANSIYVPSLDVTVDPRSGEVLHARLMLPSGIADGTQMIYKVTAMIHEPESRCRILPDSKMQELLRLKMTDIAGRALGFKSNYSSSFAYDIEDLRSPEFTQKNGLAPSIMGTADLYNNIAQVEDVAKGARLTQIGIGKFDYFAVKCLYKPMQATSFKDKCTELDKWIGEVAHDPIYQFRQEQFDDYSVQRDDLGNDHTAALKYIIPNLKLATANFVKWYADDDSQIEVRSRMSNLLHISLWHAFDRNELYVGGMIFNDDYILKNGMAPFVGVPRKKQEEAVRTSLKQLQDVDWSFSKDLDDISMKMTDIWMTRNSCFARLLKRTSRLAYANNIATDPECVFPVEDYYNLLYDYVFGKTKRNEKLTDYDVSNQSAFLGMLIMSANMHEFIGTPPPMPIPGGGRAATIAAIAKAQPQVLTALGRTDALAAMSPQKNTYDRTEPKVNMNVEEPVSAYQSRGREFQVPDYVLAPMFFKSLQQTQTLMQRAFANSTGADRIHYQYMLRTIRQAMEAKTK